jgi:hypothetical protein
MSKENKIGINKTNNEDGESDNEVYLSGNA